MPVSVPALCRFLGELPSLSAFWPFCSASVSLCPLPFFSFELSSLSLSLPSAVIPFSFFAQCPWSLELPTENHRRILAELRRTGRSRAQQTATMNRPWCTTDRASVTLHHTAFFRFFPPWCTTDRASVMLHHTAFCCFFFPRAASTRTEPM